MKKIFYILLALIMVQSQAISKVHYVCQNIVPTKGNVVEKVTGVDFIERKGVETIIEKYLRFTLKSKINFKLDTPNARALRNGEFKSFTATAKKIQVDGVSISDFEAKSVCPYNKFLMKKEGDICINKDKCLILQANLCE